jgi:hypothetical protein
VKGKYMDSRENALAAEANTLWNSMTPELQEKCPRRGESVPRLLRQYEHIIGERPRYPKTVFSTVSWALGALFALALVWLLRVDNDFAQRAIRWSALVFIVVVDLGWYYWCHWHHAKHEEELLAWDRSVRSVLGKLSDFICLVNGPSDRPLQTVSPAGGQGDARGGAGDWGVSSRVSAMPQGDGTSVRLVAVDDFFITLKPGRPYACLPF